MKTHMLPQRNGLVENKFKYAKITKINAEIINL